MKTKTSLKQKVEKSGWIFYGDETIADTCPTEKGTVELFKVNKYISVNELAEEYKARKLVPASPQQVLEFNSPEKHVATQWNNNGYCFAAFDRWGGERIVRVYRDGSDWFDDWWFAGLRTIGTQHSDAESYSDTKNLELRVQKLEEIIKHHNLG